ncbi:hypothetical protein BVRB_7g165130 [Beta vulgaris subsp. vulgaris]|nr:hypothetical protein BVRB_7g165130 [Beta vulgaris subsp. vulgaris]
MIKILNVVIFFWKEVAASPISFVPDLRISIEEMVDVALEVEQHASRAMPAYVSLPCPHESRPCPEARVSTQFKVSTQTPRAKYMDLFAGQFSMGGMGFMRMSGQPLFLDPLDVDGSYAATDVADAATNAADAAVGVDF